MVTQMRVCRGIRARFGYAHRASSTRYINLGVSLGRLARLNAVLDLTAQERAASRKGWSSFLSRHVWSVCFGSSPIKPSLDCNALQGLRIPMPSPKSN